MNTPKLPPLPEPMSVYKNPDDAWTIDAYTPADMQAYAIAAIQAQGVPDVQRTRNLLARYENQWHRMGELWERCQGKGWPEAESKEFAMLRDELTPATRNLLLASAPPAPQASVTQQDPTDDQIMATVGRKGFGFSDSRPLGQQWSQVCDLIRAVVSERCTHPAQQAKPPEWFAIWIRNNYQDYPNIQSLCDALIAAANASMEE